MSARARILIAEDDLTLAHILRFNLVNAGFSVTVAVNGVDALEAAQCDKFDLLITDEHMPRMSGVTLCRRLRNDLRYAETPIIFVTGKGFEIESEILELFGSETTVIHKPFSPRALVSTIEAKLGRSTVVP